MENWSDDALKEFCLNKLRSMYGSKKVSKLVSFHATRWNSDPFSLVAYSFPHADSIDPEPGTFLLDHPVESRLFFAGEHTSKFGFGTIHGAYFTGQTVAERCLKS